MDTEKKPKVGFVPCLTIVKQGVANPKLEKMKPTKEEMKQIVKELRLREAEFKNRPADDQISAELEEMSEDDVSNENAVDDYYDMSNYDDEPVEPAGVSYDTDALLLNSAQESEEEESEEEAEEFTVKPDDNIIVTGQVSDDVCLLQVYVLNTERQEFFLFNDTYLPSYPVALEWLDFNPKDSATNGHFAAVGYMEPEIQVWDLNVKDCLEPAFSLGSKKKNTVRHQDAVMDLSWNLNARNVLASGSADKTVIVWDMNTCVAATRLECFREKVQSVKWHPLETQSLLTGCCDGYVVITSNTFLVRYIDFLKTSNTLIGMVYGVDRAVKLFDCRTRGTNKSWVFEGEIERIMWNKFDPLHFFASTEKGMVHYVDIRDNKPIWNLNAHTSAVGGLALSSYCKDMLVTGSQDETAKVWDLKDDSPSLVTEKNMHIGHIYAISACPDSPFVFAAGGANPSNHLYVWDAREIPGVVTRFNDRLHLVIPENGDSESDEMEEEAAVSSSKTLFFKEKKTLQLQPESIPSTSTSATSSTDQTSVKERTKKKKNQKKQ